MAFLATTAPNYLGKWFGQQVVSNSCDPMGCNPPAPLPKGFSRQEYQSGLPFPSPRDLPDPGIEPGSPSSQADSFTSEPGMLLNSLTRDA